MASVFRGERGRRLAGIRASSLAAAPGTGCCGRAAPDRRASRDRCAAGSGPLGPGGTLRSASALAGAAQALLVRVGLQQIQPDLGLARPGPSDAVHLPLDLVLEE